MAGYTLKLHTEDNLVLSGPVASRLISSSDGDAALLYLALLRRNGGATPEELAADLSWPSDRINRAEGALLSMGLLGGHRPAAADTEPPARERSEFSRDELVALSERDARFAGLTAEVQRKLGKQLMFPDLQILAGLYHDVGLPVEVIFMLVNHCVDRMTSAYGSGRRPTLRQIEKEGYYWAKLGLMDLESAGNYLKNYSAKQGQIPRLMRALGLGDRHPSPSEEKYLISWLDMGFTAEAIEEAYDRTVVKKHELNWKYMNGIFTRWNRCGAHTLPEIRAAEEATAEVRAEGEDLSWMKEYL